MLVNKEVLKYSSEVMNHIEDFAKDGKFQEVHDFIKTHPELPEVHFLNRRIGTDVRPFLATKAIKTQVKAIEIIALAVSGSAEMKDVEYVYLVDVDYYEQAKANKFKDCTSISHSAKGYNLRRVPSVRFYEVAEPRFYWDIEF